MAHSCLPCRRSEGEVGHTAKRTARISLLRQDSGNFTASVFLATFLSCFCVFLAFLATSLVWNLSMPEHELQAGLNLPKCPLVRLRCGNGVRIKTANCTNRIQRHQHELSHIEQSRLLLLVACGLKKLSFTGPNVQNIQNMTSNNIRMDLIL